MRRVCVLLFVLAMVGAPATSVSAKETTETYVPGALFSIWCGAEPHPILPVGSPTAAEDPLRWLFSGEPECLPQDAVNTYRESQGEERRSGGIGGVAVIYDAEDIGKTITSTPADRFSGTQIWHTLHARAEEPEEDVKIEGCGILSATLPYPESHWQSWPEVQGILWDQVDPIGVDTDLTMCASSGGELHFVW